MDRKYSKEAKQFVQAIVSLADNEESLSLLEDYLSKFFDVWLRYYACTPAGIADQLKDFADIGDAAKVG